MNDITELFNHTGDGAITVDENQRIISWNAAAAAMLGYTREEVLGEKCWELLLGHTVDGKLFCKPNCSIRRKLEDDKLIVSFDLLVRHKSGDWVRVNVSTIPIPPAENEGKSGKLVHLWRPLGGTAVPRQRLCIHLLGATTVTRCDGQMVGGALWSRVKVRALLAYLAIQRGQPVSRERLIEVLWPDLDYQAALHNLNTTVYNLRHSLEPNLKKASQSAFVAYQCGQYFLADAEIHWIDTRAFEDHIRTARRATNSLDKIDAYKSAIALYRGDYLADLDGTNIWSNGERAHYQLLYLAAMNELGQEYEAQGQDDEAERWYVRVLAVDPCRENTAQRLIRLLMRQGRRVDALQRCQHLAASLEQELDVMLSAESSDLMAQIRLAA